MGGLILTRHGGLFYRHPASACAEKRGCRVDEKLKYSTEEAIGHFSF